MKSTGVGRVARNSDQMNSDLYFAAAESGTAVERESIPETSLVGVRLLEGDSKDEESGRQVTIHEKHNEVQTRQLDREAIVAGDSDHEIVTLYDAILAELPSRINEMGKWES